MPRSGLKLSRLPGEKTKVGRLLARRRVAEEGMLFDATKISMSGAISLDRARNRLEVLNVLIARRMDQDQIPFDRHPDFLLFDSATSMKRRFKIRDT